jgi:cation transporter-like permease
VNTYVPPQPQPEPLNPADPSAPAGAPGRRRSHRPERAEQGGLRAVLIIVGVFAVLGIAAGVVWQQMAPQVEMQMTEIGPYPVNELEAGQLMSMDGWYAALAGCLGLIAGSVLATIFLRHAWVMVLGLLAGSVLAAVLAFTIGTVMGNGEIIVAWQPEAKLWSPLSAPLQLHAYGVALIWPIAALAPIVPLAWWAWPLAEPDDETGTTAVATQSSYPHDR